MARALAHAAVAAVLATVPAAASAATIDPLEPCYVSAREQARELVRIAARGFTPNSVVSVAFDGVVAIPNAQVGPDGALSGSLPAPFVPSGERPFTLTLTERDNSASTVSASSMVTALDVQVVPRNARPAARVLLRGRGFTDGAVLYGHYLYRGRLRRTVRLAASSAPCGTFEARRRLLPVPRPRTGRWTLQLDQDPTWRQPPRTMHFLLTIDVRRTDGRQALTGSGSAARVRVKRSAPSAASTSIRSPSR